MSNFYIADLHLCSCRGGVIDGRTDLSTEERLSDLIWRWNEQVEEHDSVYILGDFIDAPEGFWPSIVRNLNGQKILIAGNHDPVRMSKETRACFRDICRMTELSDSGKHVILCHYPIPFHRLANHPDCWMLYGHVHMTREWAFLESLRRSLKASCDGRGHAKGNFVNVGCMLPYMSFAPQTLDTIIEREAAFRNSVESLRTCSPTIPQ